MNKKKIAVIVGAILVVIGIVLCIFLIGGNSDDTTDPNVSSTATADEAQTSEEYETLKEKVKDIYDYVPVEPYSFEVEGEVHKVKKQYRRF